MANVLDYGLQLNVLKNSTIFFELKDNTKTVVNKLRKILKPVFDVILSAVYIFHKILLVLSVWGSKIGQLHRCRRIILLPPPKCVLDMILNHLMVRLSSSSLGNVKYFFIANRNSSSGNNNLSKQFDVRGWIGFRLCQPLLGYLIINLVNKDSLKYLFLI